MPLTRRLSSSMRARVCAFLPPLVILVLLTSAAWPMLASGERTSLNTDFYQFALRHELLRKSILEYHTVPLRSHWVGGGYPTIADPEDPTFDPLAIISVLFGAVRGLKWIEYIAMLAAGLGTYAFTRVVLRYSCWGSLLSGIVYGASLFIPARVHSGNLNEVWVGFLPVSLLLLGLACRGSRTALVALPCLFAAMLSDGKLACLMAMFYVGVVCATAFVAGTPELFDLGGAPPSWAARRRPLKLLLVMSAMTALIASAKIFPTLELINSLGGFRHAVGAHPGSYIPERIDSYSFGVLWRELVGVRGYVGRVSVGLIPLVLSALAAIRWRATLPWSVGLLVCTWLAMAYHAPVDLLKGMWHLPIFESIYRPDKYFGFQIVFSIAVLSGQGLDLIRRVPWLWIRRLMSGLLVVASAAFFYPKIHDVLSTTYEFEAPEAELPTGEQVFFQVAGRGLPDGVVILRDEGYNNVRKNIGTIDWYTGVPLPAHAAPKYFVTPENGYVSNPDYRGEAYIVEPASGRLAGSPAFAPNQIYLSVFMDHPGTVVINQNFNRDWYSNTGPIVNWNGLLAVSLPQGVHEIRLRYRPRMVLIGVGVSLVSLLMLLVCAWVSRTGLARHWASNGAGPLRGIGLVVVFLLE